VFRRRRMGANPPASDGSEADFTVADEAAEDDDRYDYDDELDEDEPGEFEDDEAGEFEDDEADDFGESGEFENDEAGPRASVAAEEEAAPAQAGPRRGAHRAGRDDLGDPTTWTRLRDSATAEPAHVRSAGPWDSGDAYPEAERLDLGCLQVPVGDDTNVQLAYSEETGVTLAVVAGESALQLQAFAAPRSSGLWEKVRPEIADEVAKAGGRSDEQEGPFGPEVAAWVTPQIEGQGPLPPQPLRFLGADGPRWFLRGLISGPAAVDPNLARPLENVFAEVVVVRGDHAAPPETPLEIQLPEEARQAFESQAQAEAEQSGMPNPFERGPEITEIR
jgi:hypothetical protein